MCHMKVNKNFGAVIKLIVPCLEVNVPLCSVYTGQICTVAKGSH